MVRKGLLVVLASLVVAASASAQASWRFRWQKGQVFLYGVEQSMTASEMLTDGKTESTTKTVVVKRWQVQDVDAAGIATLQLSLDKLRLEKTTASGDALVYDSSDATKSDPQLKEQLARYVGQPIAVLRLDGFGKLVEVKKSDFGPASRFEADLPFLIVLPGADFRAGQYWERNYKVTLEPPQGTGEKFDAVQRYTCKEATAAGATLLVSTTLKTMPDSLLDRVPLLQLQPEGEVVFDAQLGLMRSARLTIDKELKNHQGDGTSYRFQRSYAEQYVRDK
ncbi:MAG TPA: hypothetical protein VKE94_23920 [Gemmataceae bacterium]|nr:hypothetical protein [Gemmataceae bacterium]